jgi:hypothetical protein
VVKPKKGNKISDLSGTWKMSDKEAEEIKTSLNALWRNPPSNKEGIHRQTSNKKLKRGKQNKDGFGALKGVGFFTAKDEL